MASSFTLDDIRAAAEAKYGSTDIKLSDGRTCRLLNPLRLPKDKRDELMKLQDRMDVEEGEEAPDQEDVFSDAIRLVAEHPWQADQLLTDLNGDLALLAIVFSNYTEGSQVGEASASQD